jgi:hypothetical protein
MKTPVKKSVTTRKSAPAKTVLKKGAVKTTAAKKPYPDNTGDNTRPPQSVPKDAVDLLCADHLAVGKCFKQYQTMMKKGASAAERQALALKVCAMLTVHTTIEEEIFYPAARAAGLESDMLDEADVEHAGAKDLIAQITAGKPSDDHYDAKVKVLGDVIEHHVVEEHTEMFPKCRRSTMDLIALRVQMASRKQELESA